MLDPDARVLLVDRDGVINVNRPGHVRSWDELEFLPGALDGLALLASGGFEVVVVSNQAAINRGLLTRSALDEIHRRMVDVIEWHGGRVRGIFICPHRPDEGCGCRKPEPGLLLAAQAEAGVHLPSTTFVGDHFTDLEAADRGGCSSILVLSGRVTSCAGLQVPSSCQAILPDLYAAARYMVEHDADTVSRPRTGAAGLLVPAGLTGGRL